MLSYESNQQPTMHVCYRACLAHGVTHGAARAASAARFPVSAAGLSCLCGVWCPAWDRIAMRPHGDVLSRRQAAMALASTLLVANPPHAPLLAEAVADATLPSTCKQPSAEFRSGAFEQPNYSNAVTASRDTNVSPKEAYDVIAARAVPPPGVPCPRALDLGAGAGVSTQFLWLNGFRDIVAVDPSRVAWDKFVGPLPAGGGVVFEQNSDDGYLAKRPADAPLFDLVLVNFAINQDKAQELCELLTPEGRLLAPVNQQRNYFFRQEFRLYDRSTNVLWRTDTSGGWAITFQPDYTSPSCQGQWCPQFRGPVDRETLKLE